MPVKLGKRTATLSGTVSVEEAEPLATWLRETDRPAVNLKACAHLHAAALQALLAARVRVSVAPADPFLSTWVLPALQARTAPVPQPAKEATTP